MKKQSGDICKGTLDIECERDWSAGLGATLGDGQKIKNYFSSFRDYLDLVAVKDHEMCWCKHNTKQSVRRVSVEIQVPHKMRALYLIHKF